MSSDKESPLPHWAGSVKPGRVRWYALVEVPERGGYARLEGEMDVAEAFRKSDRVDVPDVRAAALGRLQRDLGRDL